MFKNRVKGLIALVVVSVVMVCPVAQGKSIEKGNPVGRYYNDGIILEDGNSVQIGDSYTALFINGTLVTGYEVIIKEGRSLVPIRLITEQLGCKVEWENEKQLVTIIGEETQIKMTIGSKKVLIGERDVTLDEPALLKGGVTYVPLRFIAENLECTVSYASSLREPYTYYYETEMPLSSAGCIVREYPNIIIDEKYSEASLLSIEEALVDTQAVCGEGLANYKKTMVERLISAGEMPDVLDGDFKRIEQEISRMVIVGEVSRYYKFSIGAYDILWDKYNGNIFFEMYSSGVKVKKVDINDPELFTAVFIVG